MLTIIEWVRVCVREFCSSSSSREEGVDLKRCDGPVSLCD